jgi:hypothetical protein
MQISNIEEITVSLINSILLRIDSIEHFSYTNWITIAISFVAIVISFFSLKKNNSVTKDNALENIKRNIDTAKTQYETLCMQVAESKSNTNPTEDEKRALEIKNSILDSAFEKVLNAYEDGCSLFYKGKVNKKDFKEKYQLDIQDYVKRFPDKFTEPLTSYTNVVKFHKEEIKMQK